MDILQHKIVTTRKEHKCWGCAYPYPGGSSLRYRVEVDNGEFRTSYWCDLCECFMDWMSGHDPLFYYQDGIAFGEFKGDSDYQYFLKELYQPRPDRVALKVLYPKVKTGAIVK